MIAADWQILFAGVGIVLTLAGLVSLRKEDTQMIVIEGLLPRRPTQPPGRWARLRARVTTLPQATRQGWRQWLLIWSTLAAVEAGRRTP